MTSLILNILLWSSIINIGILLFWFIIFLVARKHIYNIHSKWFPMPEEKFYAIHYAALAFYKLSIFVFNIVPYIAIKIAICSTCK